MGEPGPFEFLTPRALLAGHGKAKAVGHALHNAGVGDGTVVVVADRIVADNGLCDSLVSGLDDAGLTPRLLAEITGEPDAQLVERLVDEARKDAPVAVVGIGGGSAMDTAKLVALLVRNEIAIDSLGGVLLPDRPVAPLALVPTTTGTGAEATRIAMVSVAGAKRIVNCVQFVPHVAVLDPELVAELPPGVVSATALDALAHALESSLSTNRTPVTVALGERAAEMLLRNVGDAVLEGDARAKGRLLYGAYLAGLALNAGVVLGHSLGYVIARRAHLAHGVSCALALPYCLAYNQGIDPARAAAISRVVTGGGDSLAPAARALSSLATQLGLPQSLAEVGIERTQLGEMAAETVRDYPRPNNPVPLEEEPILRLLEGMYDGDMEGALATAPSMAA